MAVHIGLIAAAVLAGWVVLACILGPFIGRRLKRRQPTNQAHRGNR